MESVTESATESAPELVMESVTEWRRDNVVATDGPRARPPAGATRRGPAVVVLLALATAFVLLTGGIVGAHQQHAEVQGTATIQPGETLWDVAVEHAPDGTDPRTYLARIRQVNDVDAGTVRPWTVVLLPAS